MRAVYKLQKTQLKVNKKLTFKTAIAKRSCSPLEDMAEQLRNVSQITSETSVIV